MIDEVMLKRLIIEGQSINNHQYYEHVQLTTPKTFFFFVKRLSQEQIQRYLSASVLREFILQEIRKQGITIDKNFNPEGWFGRFWTEYPQKKSICFKKEYPLILERKRVKPYYYAIKPEYYPLVKQIITQVEQKRLPSSGQESNIIASDRGLNDTDNVPNKIFFEIQEILQTEERKDSESGVFDPQNLQDARERCLSQIVKRRGQGEFRQRLLKIYNGKCAITGCNAEPALEAAHIIPYLGIKTNHPSNGILLRADIHTLFDLHLITIDTASMTVLIAQVLMNTSYKELLGRKLLLPNGNEERPSKDALDLHRKESGL